MSLSGDNMDMLWEAYDEDDAFLGDDEFDEECDSCPECDVHLGYGESHDSECPYA